MLPKPVIARARILDDDKNFLEEMSQFLAGEGFEIAFASENHEGILFNVAAQDVFFIDIRLPGKPPADLFHSIAHHHPENPVVLMTGLPADIAQIAHALAKQCGLRVLGIYFKDDSPEQIRPMVLLHRDEQPMRQWLPAPTPEQIRAQVQVLLERDALTFAFQRRVDTTCLGFAGAETLLPDCLPGLAGATPRLTAEALRDDPPLSYRLHLEAVRQATALCHDWQSLGWRGAVGINIPGECLEQPAFVHDLRQMVSQAGLAPSNVTIELMEDTQLQTDAILNTLVALRMDGFGLALDDVGQRESGLLRLASLPVTEIKIDRSLVHAARDWARALSVYQHLCSMARSMGIVTVAEGIEREEDIRTANVCGVDFLQGFHLGCKQPGQALLGTLAGRGTAHRMTDWRGDVASFS